ncbi:MAG: site-specific DNA-methyltransferase [Oscillospiraceae bacterium]|jgi:adenine-specific DNA-methyltransferase|nr:site-specific DNA-methyltransferase [Oscillospiraceae bacterium]
MSNKLDGLSLDMEQTNLDRLREIFPDCVSEGKLDIDKLLSLCGEYIDNDFEKYKFEWKGKAESLRLAQQRSAGTLRPCPAESVNFDSTGNIYIEGDNLEVLKLLQTAYYRKVKMIYIDPPYNTGNDFVYADDFADPLARYREVTAQTTRSNPETMGRFHTNWLNMMYPRLRLASTLLRDDGVIFISIDDHEVSNLRKLCDEVFGEENFIGQFIWQRAYSPKNDAKYISNSHDYVLMYAKNAQEFQIGRLPRTEEANARYSNPDNDPRGPWKSSDMSVKTYSAANDYPITAPSGRVIEPPAGRCWSLSKNAFFERLADGRILFGSDGDGVPRIKRFLNELKHDGLVPQSILFYKDVGHSQEGAQELTKLIKMGGFDGPKPVRLMKHLITLARTSPDDIILDFFSGSATTAHAVMQLNAEDGGNRQFILVQLPEVTDEKSEAAKAGYANICEIGKERIRRAGAKLQAEQSGQIRLGEDERPLLDTGFKVFKLDSSNLKAWNGTPVAAGEQMELLNRMNAMIDNVKPDRSDMDMVYEIMLKMGCPLTWPAEMVEVNGKPAYAVGEGCMLLICLAEAVTTEDVEAMCEYAPAKMIFAEGCFADDTDLANAHYILRDHEIELKLI